LRDDPRSIGIDGGNIWVNRDLDHEGAQRYSDSLLEGRPHDVFVSFPSLKSGESPHTAELISFCDARAFRQWAEQPRENRGPEYSTLKERIAQGMLELAESAAPGLTELVDYVETSTPLTYEHYTAHPAGAFSGPPATPLRFRSRPLGPRTCPFIARDRGEAAAMLTRALREPEACRREMDAAAGGSFARWIAEHHSDDAFDKAIVANVESWFGG